MHAGVCTAKTYAAPQVRAVDVVTCGQVGCASMQAEYPRLVLSRSAGGLDLVGPCAVPCNGLLWSAVRTCIKKNCH